MDSNAQYYPFDSFQPPIADSLIRDGECKNGHESCLFRIIELHHGRFTFRKLSRWKQWECRPGDTDDWYVSIIICPFRFEPHSLETMPLSARSLYTQKYFSPCFPSMYITDQNCPHRRRLTCRFEYLDEMRSFIKLTMFFAILSYVLHNVLKRNVSVIY